MMRYIATQNVPLIVSTGMQTEDTITKVYNIFNDANANFALLHCTSSYPTHVDDTKLNYICRYQKLFANISIGYSGHEIGYECSCLAILMGAKILERHFTLDKNQKGSDHCLSLNPMELRTLVTKVRLIERSFANCDITLPLYNIDSLNATVKKLNLFECPMGFIERACQPNNVDMIRKSIFPCELMCKHKLGKSLVYTRDLSHGHCLHENDICVKVSEPNGIPAEFYDDVVGKVLERDVIHDDPVMMCDIKQ
jgi:sialic acid synthase